MRARALSAVLAAAVSLAVAACGTPEPVRDLATRTAANAGQVGNQLRDLNATSQSVADARATNLAQLKSTVRDVRGRHSLDIALIRQTGDANSLSLKDNIAKWIVEARAAAHNMTVSEFEAWQKTVPVDAFSADVKAIMNNLANLDTKAKELREVGKVLAELSKEDDPQARVQFLVAYVKEVRKEVDAKQAAAEAAARAAKSTSRDAGAKTGDAVGK
jgi:hypothetical protein